MEDPAFRGYQIGIPIVFSEDFLLKKKPCFFSEVFLFNLLSPIIFAIFRCH